MSNNEFIIRGPPVQNIGDFGSLGEFLLENMRMHRGKIGKIIGDANETVTYGEMLSKSIRIAQNLQKRNLTSNDVIASCSYNTLESDLPFFAAAYIGVPIASFDPSLTPEEITHMLRQVTPKLIFCGIESVELMEDALRISGVESEIVVFENVGGNSHFSEFLISCGSEEGFEAVPVDVGDTAVIFFSSGTTGLPKGICNTHIGTLEVASTKFRPSDSHMLMYISTLYWISSVNMLILSIANGIPRLTCKNVTEENVLRSIEKYKASFIFSTPYFYKQLVKFANNYNGSFDTSSIKFISVGGETLKERNMKELKKYFSQSLIVNSYGLTEAGGAVTCFRPLQDLPTIFKKPNSVGKPMPGISYKVVDTETNEILGPNKHGEIRMKSNRFMKGYYNNPKEASEAWDEDGYLKTGDIGYYDEEFCFFVVDRIKEMFKYKMWPMAPAELENVILSHPDVQDVAVIGIPHEEDGAWPMGVIVLKPGAISSERDILDFVNNRVIDRKRLRGGVKFVTNFPYTSTGKIKRRMLRQQFHGMKE